MEVDMISYYTAWTLAALLVTGGLGRFLIPIFFHPQGGKTTEGLAIALVAIAWDWATKATLAVLVLAVLFRL